MSSILLAFESRMPRTRIRTLQMVILSLALVSLALILASLASGDAIRSMFTVAALLPTSVGLWRLRSASRIIAIFILVWIAMLLPISPFVPSETRVAAPQESFFAEVIVMLCISALCLVVAHVLYKHRAEFSVSPFWLKFPRLFDPPK